MDQQANKPSGTAPSSAMWTLPMRLVLKLTLVFLLSLTVASCAQTSGTGLRVNCAGWKPLKFDAKADTLKTIHGLQQHNAFGKKQRCKAFQ